MSQVCRTCLRIIDGQAQAHSIEIKEPTLDIVHIKAKLQACVPEIVLGRIKNSVICTYCLNALNAAYEFKTRCLETEKKIFSFVQASTESVDLSHFVDKLDGRFHHDHNANSKSVSETSPVPNAQPPATQRHPPFVQAPYNPHLSSILNNNLVPFRQVNHAVCLPPVPPNLCSPRQPNAPPASARQFFAQRFRIYPPSSQNSPYVSGSNSFSSPVVTFTNGNTTSNGPPYSPSLSSGSPSPNHSTSLLFNHLSQSRPSQQTYFIHRAPQLQQRPQVQQQQHHHRPSLSSHYTNVPPYQPRLPFHPPPPPPPPRYQAPSSQQPHPDHTYTSPPSFIQLQKGPSPAGSHHNQQQRLELYQPLQQLPPPPLHLFNATTPFSRQLINLSNGTNCPPRPIESRHIRIGQQQETPSNDGGAIRQQVLWCCHVCRKIFSSEEFLKMHQYRENHMPPSYEQAMSRQHLQQNHQASSSEKDKDFACDKCDYRTDIREAFLDHVANSHRSESDDGSPTAVSHKYRCARCSFTTSEKNLLTEHTAQTHEDGLYYCSICTFKTAHASSLRRHTRNTHLGQKRRRTATPDANSKSTAQLGDDLHVPQSDTEDSGFAQVDTYHFSIDEVQTIVHQDENGDGNELYEQLDDDSDELIDDVDSYIITADEIEKILNNDDEDEEEDDETVRNESKNGDMIFRCAVCEETFQFKYQLKKHMANHSANNRKVLECTVCDFRTTVKSQLQVHVNMHTGGTIYRCDQCSYSTIYRSNLEQHYRSHTGETRYACEYCDYRCAKLSRLKRHLQTHAENKTYQCKECAFEADDENVLLAHKEMHSMVFTVRCSVLGRQMRTKNTQKVPLY